MKTLLRIVAVIIALNVLLTAVAYVLKRRTPSFGDELTDELALAAILDGIDLQSEAASFCGGTVQTFMGGIRLDLSHAQLDPAGAHLRVKAVFGGIQLILPDDWPVRVTEAKAIMGGYDHPYSQLDDTVEPALELELEAIFGGIEVMALGSRAPSTSGDLFSGGDELLPDRQGI